MAKLLLKIAKRGLKKYADVIVDEHHLNVEQTIEKIMELKERFQ